MTYEERLILMGVDTILQTLKFDSRERAEAAEKLREHIVAYLARDASQREPYQK